MLVIFWCVHFACDINPRGKVCGAQSTKPAPNGLVGAGAAFIGISLTPGGESQVLRTRRPSREEHALAAVVSRGKKEAVGPVVVEDQ